MYVILGSIHFSAYYKVKEMFRFNLWCKEVTLHLVKSSRCCWYDRWRHKMDNNDEGIFRRREEKFVWVDFWIFVFALWISVFCFHTLYGDLSCPECAVKNTSDDIYTTIIYDIKCLSDLFMPHFFIQAIVSMPSLNFEPTLLTSLNFF